MTTDTTCINGALKTFSWLIQQPDTSSQYTDFARRFLAKAIKDNPKDVLDMISENIQAAISQPEPNVRPVGAVNTSSVDNEWMRPIVAYNDMMICDIIREYFMVTKHGHLDPTPAGYVDGRWVFCSKVRAIKRARDLFQIGLMDAKRLLDAFEFAMEIGNNYHQQENAYVELSPHLRDISNRMIHMADQRFAGLVAAARLGPPLGPPQQF